MVEGFIALIRQWVVKVAWLQISAVVIMIVMQHGRLKDMGMILIKQY